MLKIIKTTETNEHFSNKFPIVTIELGGINLRLRADEGGVLHVIRSDGIENLDFDERLIFLQNAISVIYTYMEAVKNKPRKIEFDIFPEKM